MQPLIDHPSDLSFWGHFAAVTTWLAAVAGLLPALAALVGVIYYGIMIFESDTVQKWRDKKRAVSKAKRITKLKAEQKILIAELEALEVVRGARAVAADKVAVAAHEAATLTAIDDATHKHDSA